MLKAMIYGNCQHTHLERLLLKTDVTKAVEFLSVKDVYCKDKKFLDSSSLQSLDYFIYQHVSANFDPFFSTDNLIKELKSSCTKICIPNFWCGCLWPSYIKNPVIRPNPKYSISTSGLFPYGDKEVIRLLQDGYSKKEIIDILSDPEFYSLDYLELNLEQNLQVLRDRETEFDVTFRCADYIQRYFKTHLICYSINHPTKHYFDWLAKKIYKHIVLSDLGQYETFSPFERGHIHVPLYPSVISKFKIPYYSADPSVEQYRFYNEKVSFKTYLSKYIDHATGQDLPGKDSIDIRKWNAINLGAVKLVNSKETKSNLNVLKEYFGAGKTLSKPSKNLIDIDGNVIEVSGNKTQINGLTINFRGNGNLIKIGKNVKFLNATLHIGSDCYVKFCSESTFKGLVINNSFHRGGVCCFGDQVEASNLSVSLFGNNKCVIGNGCLFDDNVKILCSDGHVILDEDGDIVNQNGNIVIGSRVWLGLNSKILKGANIGENSVVGANSCIESGLYPPNSYLVGSPAVVKKTCIHWQLENPEHIHLVR